MNRSLSLLALCWALFAVGCPTTDPGDDDDATANDDDATANDDDATGDDDDATVNDDDATGDDDDATGDDDDSTEPPVDADGDGVDSSTDCDDNDAANYPGNTEVCDAGDNDCDATTFAPGENTDVDSDGSVTCLDCDDGDVNNFPGNTELCDGQDNDCLGGANADALGETDGDLDLVLSCDDCDDADPANYPGNTEVCDGQDNDCAGGADFDLAGEIDFDLDGSISCIDCDDANSTVTPGGPELCDGLDNDCDGGTLGLGYTSALGVVDDIGADRIGNQFFVSTTTALDTFAIELDPDGDFTASWQVWDNTSGTPVLVVSLDAPMIDLGQGFYTSPGFGGELLVAGSTYILLVDIGLTNTRYFRWTPTFPLTTPFGQVTNGVVGGTGMGGAAGSILLVPYEFSIVVTGADEVDGDTDGALACADCDDGDPANYPGNVEVCDGFDNDCNRLADADVDGEIDGDVDGFLSCLDCDDTDLNSFPGGAEVCDGADNDCDPTTEAGDGETDDDGDGTINCEDCEDLDPSANPGATEVCDGLDTNCDGAVPATYTLLGTTNLSGANRYRGNRFEVTTTTLLTAFSMELSASAGQSITFAVYEASTALGTYTLIASNDVEVPSALAGQYNEIWSGAFGVELEAGKFYGLVAWWGAESVGYSASGVGSPAFGNHLGALWGTASTLPTSPSNPGTGGYYAGSVLTDDEGDFDGDGAIACDDCDDGQALAYPGNLEDCDGIDNDCSGAIDAFGFTLSNATPVAIDSTTGWNAQSSIEVAENGVIADVNVTLDITHTYDDDLDISLMSPTGTVITLSSSNGSSGNNYTGTVFDDEASTPVTSGSAPFSGSFTPEMPLSTFDGEASAGTWTLIVNDLEYASDNGTLNSWTLDLVLDGGGCTAATCLELLTTNPNAADGLQVLNPSGVMGAAAEYECDMANGGWTQVFFNDFDTIGPDAGWSTTATYSCGGDELLGGFNNQAGGLITISVDTSEFVHTEARIETEYWAIDSWDGEAAWIDIDGVNIFAANFVTGGTPNLCGNVDASWTENVASVDQTTPHSAGSLFYSAGSTLDQAADDESFGVDDVVVWVR